MKGLFSVAMVLLLCMVEGLSYYEILQVNKDASDSTIETAYREIASRYHPDKGNESEREMRTKFMEQARDANEILLNHSLRKILNRSLPQSYVIPDATSYQLNPYENWLHFRKQEELARITEGKEGVERVRRAKEVPIKAANAKVQAATAAQESAQE